jgi:hypothetical protein
VRGLPRPRFAHVATGSPRALPIDRRETYEVALRLRSSHVRSNHWQPKKNPFDMDLSFCRSFCANVVFLGDGKMCKKNNETLQ